MREPLIKALLHLLAHLPLSWLHRIANWTGRYYASNDNKHSLVTRLNIERCFPELAADEQQQLTKQTLIEGSKTLLECGKIWLGSRDKVSAFIQQVSGEEHLKAGLARGKGVILVAPHLGNWEMLGVYCAPRYPMTNLYRPPRMATLNSIILNGRKRYQQKLAPTDAKGIRMLYQVLAKNEVIGILPDQDPRVNSGSFAPFFGIQANTMTLLSRLIQKSDAAVLLTYAERLPDSKGFHLHFIPALTEVSSPDTQTSVIAINQMIEDAVRTIPAQYQWNYKRFATRPEGEAEFY
ncbi:MAG: lysophospholipid acyltransferase family protein [Gammaproteobacteria bacterium]|nr:lysophospholipid acyltransferase family protein [Gammaproteobacteria bacterium]